MWRCDDLKEEMIKMTEENLYYDHFKTEKIGDGQYRGVWKAEITTEFKFPKEPSDADFDFFHKQQFDRIITEYVRNGKLCFGRKEKETINGEDVDVIVTTSVHPGEKPILIVGVEKYLEMFNKKDK